MLFTHSEVANGTVLLATYFANSRSLHRSAVLGGRNLLHQRFHGHLAGAGAAAGCHQLLQDGKIELRRLLRQAIPGAAMFAVFAAPVVYNVLSNPSYEPDRISIMFRISGSIMVGIF